MKRLAPIGLLAGAVLMTPGCAKLMPAYDDMPAAQRKAIACEAYENVLDKVTVQIEADLMSKESRTRVANADALVGPLCMPGSTADPTSVINQVEAALIVMIAERRKAEGQTNGR